MVCQGKGHPSLYTRNNDERRGGVTGYVDTHGHTTNSGVGSLCNGTVSCLIDLEPGRLGVGEADQDPL